MRDDDKEYAFWTTAPFDPIQAAKDRGGVHYSRATRGVLFHQSAMPLGKHLGKIMERVPAADLLWIHRQPWAKQGRWHPVWDYVERHLAEIEARAELAKAPPSGIIDGNQPSGEVG